ncbi:response regulator [Staphylococcus succinus]|jgi:response regulator of citrate/malate metabolism|uniref:response regulator n=1 Tax=Staphylococcus succinus TaxID=61015 RepID=UPI000935EAAC|nr:response regulator [Staphylococcus succinus]MEB8127738.1 response regulator [Staphylococcus succinus]PTI41831.1 two-component system response regulator DcuR [Staphylococcus succinus]PTJ20690.1 two-component system response regulator DcuR [Staphylococcus succinus]RIN27770.1 response regulator [Staphylococcus succinus]RIN30936.1 response regulator [Staphylococcus succinus]
MIHVLIVEDDPMVAQLNKQFIEKIDGYDLVAITHNVSAAITTIEQTHVDLILLDVYMPEQNGLSLLTYIREHHLKIDAILITAASDVDQIQKAFRYGAMDYLIKPFEFERFKKSLLQYKEKLKFYNDNQSVSQSALDNELFNKKSTSSDSNGNLPKGLTKGTLQSIVNKVNHSGKTEFSTDEIAEIANISRVSVRKYLKFLADIDVLEETLTYGIGRPVYLYHFKQENLHFLNEYVQ